MTDWPTMRLEECCEIVSGATPKTSVVSYWDGNICWATPKDLSGLAGAIISDTPRKVTSAGLRSCAATILPAGSVLFSSRAPIGHVAINAVPMATNQGFKSMIPKTGIIDANYLYHWLRCNRAYLESLGNGATFKEVSKAVVSRIEVPVPPLPEQHRIAAILDQADALRAKRRETLAKLDEMAQAIFLEMFGDPLENPRGLRKEKLANLIKVKSGEFLPAAKMAESGAYPVLGGNGINGHHSSYLFEHSQIVIGRVGAYCGCVHVSPPKSWVTDNALYVASRSADLEFDYLRHALVIANLNSVASKFGQPLISGSRVYPVEILVPAIREQQEFARRISATSELLGQLTVSQTSFDTLFASLQHCAFGGEL